MTKKILAFAISFLMWMLLNWKIDASYIIIGVLAAAFATYIISDLLGESSLLFRDPRRMARLIFVYVPLFLVGMLKAAVSVAFSILHPALPIRPGIVKVMTGLKTDRALTLLANTITLTSETLTVDIDRDAGVLYVHWVDVKAKDVETATQLIVSRFEPLIKSIFE